MRGHATVIESFKEDLEAQGLTHESLMLYAQQARRFLGWLDREPETITREDLKKYTLKLQREKKDPQTIHSNFVGIGSLMQFLEEEDRIEVNPVPGFRRRSMRNVMREVGKRRTHMRKLVSVEEMARFISTVLDVRDQAIALVLAKTGMRREECIQLDVEDVDWSEQSITIKEHSKRSQPLVFFDDETARVLRRWLVVREARGANPTKGPLFTGSGGGRIHKNELLSRFTEHAAALDLHVPGGKTKDKFTPHCCRHWFTTWLRRAKMNPAHVAWLRGDKESSTQSIYNHIDREEVRQEYLALIPQLGIA